MKLKLTPAEQKIVSQAFSLIRKNTPQQAEASRLNGKKGGRPVGSKTKK